MIRYSKTYHGGAALDLQAASDRFVSRATEPALADAGFEVEERLSAASFVVRTAGDDLDESIRRARELGPAFPLYSVRGTRERFLMSDRVFVRFQPGLNAAQQSDVVTRYGKLVERYDEDEVLMQLSPERDPVASVVALTEEQERVALAEHDLNHRIVPTAVQRPTDFLYPQQWHLHQEFVSSMFDPRVSTMCSDAWDLLGSYGSRDVVVGITDSGCDVTNPDFKPAAEKFAGWGYFRGRFIVTNQSPKAQLDKLTRDSAHGTAMAGLIAAAVNEEFAVGIAPGCRLLPIRFESNGIGQLNVATSSVRTAFRYLSSRADIVSNSWSVGEVSLWGTMFAQELAKMARSGGRRGKGMIFVFAAGNSNCPIDRDLRTDQDVPIDNGRDVLGRFVGPRTARVFQNDTVGITGVIHVGAVSSRGQRSHYSNYGRGVRLCAPSDNFHLYQCPSVEPKALTLNTSPSESVLTSSPGGTSAATAIVAGVAALVISANPSLSGPEVISILQQTATKDLDFTPYPRTPASCSGGDGSFDISPVPPFDDGRFRNTGHPDGTWSPWFGFGSVNAGRAVARARQLADEASTRTLMKEFAELST